MLLRWVIVSDVQYEAARVPGPRGAAADSLPPGLCDGLDEIAAAADDFGHVTHLVPRAVARPRTAEDIAALVTSAGDLAVRPRGAGHSVSGQAQCDSGVVCVTTGLDDVSVEKDRVRAGAGARWSAVLTAAFERGLTPPVLTDYLELTVGGTLSAGGVGGSSYRYGPQVDHVHELELVTADGARISCLPGDKLSDAVLAGQGQAGVITSATMPLVPAPPRVCVAKVVMPSLAALIAAQRQLAREGRVGYLEGQIAPAESGGWSYLLEAAAFHPADATALGGLEAGPSAEIEEVDYLTFCHRMTTGSRLLMATGDWYRPHPWLCVFLPCGAVEQFVADALAELSVDLLGPIPMLLDPLRRGPRPAPGLVTPVADADGLFYLFSILRTVPDTAEAIAAALASNAALARRAAEMGGSVYPAASITTLLR